MGYSCTALASFALDRLMERLQGAQRDDKKFPSNGWIRNGCFYFWERGREQPDGAATGSVLWWECPTRDPARLGRFRGRGTFRIDADGVIVRWPSSQTEERDLSAQAAIADHIRKFQTWPAKHTVRENHPGSHLMSASFVCV